MTTLMRYDPFRETLSLRDAVNRLFEQSFVRPLWGTTGSYSVSAPMDVFETGQNYQVKVLLPGVKPEDIELSVQENTLSIKGQYQPTTGPNEQVNWLVQEIGTGTFERTITFAKPIIADSIETSYEHGVLSIVVPISEASRPKKISITGGQPKLVEANAH